MANRFWVGGTGVWDASSTANWSLTSGGAAGASAPTSADAAFFDSLSGTGTCTTATGATCLGVAFNSSTLSLSLGDSLPVLGPFTLTLGSISLGTSTLSCTAFASSNSNIRSIDFGTGNITLTGNAGTIWNTATDTSLTIIGIAVVNSTYAGSTGTRNFTSGATTTSTRSISVNITAGSDTVTINNFNNINFTGFAGALGNSARSVYGNLIISSGMTLTAGTNATTFAATSSTQQITTNGKTLDFPLTQNSAGTTLQLQDNLTMGATRGFTLTAGTLDLNNQTLSTGFISSTNANTRSIAFGTGNITVTANNGTVWNTSNSTGFSVTGTPVINATYAGAVGTRTINLGNAGEANAISVNVSAGTDTVALTTSNGAYKNINLTGFAGVATVTGSILIFGDLTVPAGITFSSVTAIVSFRATSGTQTITANNVTFDFPVSINAAGATVQFADALTQGSTRNFQFIAGTIQLKNGVTSTVGAFTTSGTSQKFLQSTLAGSQATLSQASGTVNASYLTIQDINATGGATWNAFVNHQNIDAGNNDGWDFSLSPIVGGVEYTYSFRSFTQPRRF